MTNEITIKEEVQLQKITEYFEAQGVVDFFSKNCGYSPEIVKREAIAFATKTNMQDLKTIESNKKAKHPRELLKDCTSLSKQQVFMSLLAWGLPTDARDLYYLYNEKGNMTCEPSYKGLIYIAEKNGLSVHAGLVFEGDDFQLKETDEGDTYTLVQANPFMRKIIIGCYVCITCKGEKRVYTYSFEELEKSRQASKKKMGGFDSPAWENYANDMYLKCGVRKAIKIAMAKISLSQSIQALFDDEMVIPEETSAPQSLKTADFESVKEIEYEAQPLSDRNKQPLMCHCEEQSDETIHKQQQFAELQTQFDYRNETND